MVEIPSDYAVDENIVKLFSLPFNHEFKETIEVFLNQITRGKSAYFAVKIDHHSLQKCITESTTQL